MKKEQTPNPSKAPPKPKKPKNEDVFFKRGQPGPEESKK